MQSEKKYNPTFIVYMRDKYNNIIKDTDRAIVFRDGKFEVIECDNLRSEQK